jgi:minor extracellular serine protease Vpr
MGKVHPGIYTATSDGKSLAIAVHSTQKLVSDTAAASRGEWLVLYANGLGLVTPGVPSGTTPPGLSSTVNPVSVDVGGVQAEVYFAGLAPGFVGLYQVNFRAPEGAPTGPEVPLSLTVAGGQSNAAKLNIQ